MTDITSLGAVHTGLESIRNLDYTILICDDVAAMRHFYTQIMRFEVHEEVPGRWIALRVGSSLLGLRPRGGHEGPERATPSVQLAFRVSPSDVEVAAAQLVESGVHLLEPVTDKPFGHRTVFFADPERNVIEIYAEI